MVIRPFTGIQPFCHVTGHASPVEALTAFGYVKMEFCGRRFPASYYGLITRLYYIYTESPQKCFIQNQLFTLFVSRLNTSGKELWHLNLRLSAY